ncbi:MAG: GntR family transcriptional regulator [Spirochaetales bacterium]
MNTEIDFSGKTQLYYQIYDILCAEIHNLTYKIGDLLPTEDELAKRFNVSRITIRKAMDLLVADSLVQRRRGYGTFVIPKRTEQSLSKVLHFSEEMQRQGHEASTVMLCNELLPATKVIASALGISDGTPVIHVSRLRCSDKIPMCIENSYLEYSKVQGIYGINFSEKSLQKTLQNDYNIYWSHATENIYATLCTKEIAQNLHVQEGSPLLYVERISYTKNKDFKEFFTCSYRGDSYCFRTELSGSI